MFCDGPDLPWSLLVVDILAILSDPRTQLSREETGIFLSLG